MSLSSNGDYYTLPVSSISNFRKKEPQPWDDIDFNLYRQSSVIIDQGKTDVNSTLMGISIVHDKTSKTIRLPTFVCFSVYTFTMVALLLYVHSDAPATRYVDTVSRRVYHWNAKENRWEIEEAGKEQVATTTMTGHGPPSSSLVPGRADVQSARVTGYFYIPQGYPWQGGQEAAKKLGIRDDVNGGSRSPRGWQRFENVALGDVFWASRLCIRADVSVLFQKCVSQASPIEWTRIFSCINGAQSRVPLVVKIEGISKYCWLQNSIIDRIPQWNEEEWGDVSIPTLFNTFVAIYRTYKTATGQKLRVDNVIIDIDAQRINYANATMAATTTKVGHGKGKEKLSSPSLSSLTPSSSLEERFEVLGNLVLSGVCTILNVISSRNTAPIKQDGPAYMSGPERRRLEQTGYTDAGARKRQKYQQQNSGRGSGSVSALVASPYVVVPVSSSAWAQFWTDVYTIGSHQKTT